MLAMPVSSMEEGNRQNHDSRLICLYGCSHPRRLHELLRGVVDVATLATFGVVNIE